MTGKELLEKLQEFPEDQLNNEAVMLIHGNNGLQYRRILREVEHFKLITDEGKNRKITQDQALFLK